MYNEIGVSTRSGRRRTNLGVKSAWEDAVCFLCFRALRRYVSRSMDRGRWWVDRVTKHIRESDISRCVATGNGGNMESCVLLWDSSLYLKTEAYLPIYLHLTTLSTKLWEQQQTRRRAIWSRRSWEIACRFPFIIKETSRIKGEQQRWGKEVEEGEEDWMLQKKLSNLSYMW